MAAPGSLVPVPRAYHVSAVVSTSLFIFGGMDVGGTILDDMWQVQWTRLLWDCPHTHTPFHSCMI